MTFAILLLLSTAWADCMSGSLSVWPEAGSELPRTGQVVLQAYGSERPMLDALGTQDVVLVRGDERVPMAIVAKLHGSFTDDQTVLSPQSPPKDGVWTLEVNGAPLVLWTGADHEAVSWRFGSQILKDPIWSGKPTLLSQRRDEFGCGPGVNVTFAVPVKQAPWVEAVVQDSAGKATTVRVPVREGQAVLGHGMCAGLLAFERDHTYTVVFTPIGRDGRRGQPSTAQAFVAP